MFFYLSLPSRSPSPPRSPLPPIPSSSLDREIWSSPYIPQGTHTPSSNHQPLPNGNGNIDGILVQIGENGGLVAEPFHAPNGLREDADGSVTLIKSQSRALGGDGATETDHRAMSDIQEERVIAVDGGDGVAREGNGLDDGKKKDEVNGEGRENLLD
jgi:hypothetical protein